MGTSIEKYLKLETWTLELAKYVLGYFSELNSFRTYAFRLKVP